MPRTPCWHVDAFADRPFTGNPAVVCFLEQERDAGWMQALAAEMNLSETAFVRRRDEAFELRWFTPAIEVDLCGHATLAAAHVLWTEGIVPGSAPIRFQTRSGELVCRRNGTLIELDFPSLPVEEIDPPEGLLAALGVDATFVGRSKFDHFVVVESERAVRQLQPDFAALRDLPVRGVIVTSLSSDPRFDVVSRFFAPGSGVDEDPVTGSAHCSLAPFWNERLQRSELIGFQASRRGGVVRTRVAGERTILAGEAVTVLKGELVGDGGSL